MKGLAESVVDRIENLGEASPRKVRRLFKALRAEVRERADHDPMAKRLKEGFGRMKRWERRDHVAMLRWCYLECLDEDRQGRVRADSFRRAGDPDA